jgi:pimeloyl-ACP methyl ester carboxylesterase
MIMSAMPPTIDAATPEKQTLSLDHSAGPLVVDVWSPRQPTGRLPILLIHGWGGSGSYWRDTAQALAATNQVIVPDLPGTGRSQPVAKAQNMYDQTATLVHVLDELGVERALVIGHSMGGAMGLLLADSQPERVERLILTSLCFFMTETEAQIFKAAMFMFRISLGLRHTRLASLPIFSQMMATRYFYRTPTDSDLVQQGFQDFLDLDAATAIACANNATDPDIEQAGSRMQVPVLLVACRQDQVMPVSNVDYTVKAIPQCEARWIDKCGHLPMVEKPAEYLQIVREFFQLDQDPKGL